jgi:hypothetical protein
MAEKKDGKKSFVPILFDERIRQSVALFCFGLQDVRVSSNVLLTSR